MNRSGRHFRFSPWPILMVLVAIGMAVGVFTVTQHVQQREVRVAELNHKLLTEQQTMRVLDAEWAYLTRPQRLEELIAMKVEQGDMPPIPAPIATIVPEAEAAVAVEPSSGVAEAKVEESKVETPKVAVKAETKPVAAKKVAAKKDVTTKKVAAKKETTKTASVKAKAKTQAVAMKNDVWPIARKNAVVQRPSQKVASMPRAGVARPIVE